MEKEIGPKLTIRANGETLIPLPNSGKNSLLNQQPVNHNNGKSESYFATSLILKTSDL